MDTSSIFGKNEEALELDFDLGLGFALAEVVHLYIAEKKLPANSVLTIRMEAPINYGHHDESNGDAFDELCEAMEINLKLT